MKTEMLGGKMGLVVAGLLLATSVAARAETYTLSYTNSTDSAFPDMTQQDFANGVDLQLHKFNIPGVTLTGVAITLTGWKSGSVGIENGESYVNRLKASLSDGLIQGQDNNAVFVFNNNIAFNGNTTSVATPGNEYLLANPTYDPSAHTPQDVANTIYSGGGSDYVVFGTLGATNTDTQGIASGFSAYTGTGYFDFTVNGSGTWGGTGRDGKGQATELTNEGGAIDIVTYTYDVIPEPATFGFAAVSCIGLYYRRRFLKLSTKS